MLVNFNLHDFLAAFLVMFAIIDIVGSVPVIINLQRRGKKINAFQISLVSLIIFVVFFYAGEGFLKLFNVDISSFAVAGSLMLFILSLEMILDVEIFKNNTECVSKVPFVPLVFPLIAGAGALTTMLSIRSQYSDVTVLSAIFVNVIWVYIVIKMVKRVKRFLSPMVLYTLQKFFGIILLAMSVKLFMSNIANLLANMN